MAIGAAAKALVLALVLSSTRVYGLLYRGELPSVSFSSRPRQLDLHKHTSTRALSKRGVASIHDLSYGHQSYNLIVEVGPVSLRVAIDTGSADAWVISSSNAEAEQAKVPTYLLNWNSPTFVAVNNNQSAYSFSFADGSVGRGFIARETFVFQNFTVPAQAFALIEQTTIPLGQGQDGISGILGLGFSRLSRISQTTENAISIVDRLSREGQLEYPMFGVSLTPQGGTLSLGAVDAGVVKNARLVEWHDIVPFPLVGQDTKSPFYLHWAIELDSLQVNGTAIDITPQYREVGRQPLALIDVGSSGIFGPFKAVSEVFDQIDSSRMVSDGVWAVPCDTDVEMVLNFGGASFTLEPADYIIGEASGNPGTCLSWPVGLPPSSDGIDWQIGVPFLRKVYTIFSYGIDKREPPLIGFYPLAANTNTTTSSVPLSDNPETPTSTVTLPQITTTLPNSLLPEPTFTTPPYVFNASRSVPTPGGRSGFGTSTYSPVLRPLNATAVPSVAGPVSTIITTDPAGHSITTTTRLPPASVILGRPDGMVDAASHHHPTLCFLVAAFFALALL